MNITHFFYSLLAIVNAMSPYVLLGFLIAGLLRVFVRSEVMARHLAGGGWKPVVKAALFGIPLPLCSCGVLPAAVALRRRGASKGAATSFLIATPQTGVDSIAATYSLLGLPFAIIRPIAALVGAVAGGMAVDRSDAAGSTDPGRFEAEEAEKMPRTFIGKIAEAVRYGLVDMVASVGKWLVIGLIVAAIITVFVPDELFVRLSAYPLIAMLLMILIAVPMYVCATGSIPIALSLMLKGLTPGVAFVLLMAGPAANFASFMVIGRAMGRKATAVYVGSVIITALLFGIIIDYLLPASWFVPAVTSLDPSCHHGVGIFETLCSILLVGLLVNAAVRNRSHSHAHLCRCCHDAAGHVCGNTEHNDEPNETDMIKTTTYKIDGMSCAHCRATVEKALSALPGVIEAKVNLANGTAIVAGQVDAAAVEKAVLLAGFTYSGPVASEC